jgi:hypothetical protein
MSSISLKIEHPKRNLRYPDDFPNKEGANQYRYGFTVYKEVIIQWDKDRDERIFKWYDSLPEKMREKIVIAQEHEGKIYLALTKEIKDLETSWDVDGEVWKLAEDGMQVLRGATAY